MAQSTVWSDRILVSPLLFDNDLNFPERVKDSPIQEYIPEAGIEAFAEFDLPGRVDQE